MNRIEAPCAAPARTIGCDVAAIGRVRVAGENLAEFRRKPGPVPDGALPANFLKNADEQTIYGLAAVYQAIHDAGLHPDSFSRWCVLAAPHKIGRTALANALPHYRQEGAWGMSPHLIPNRSLHCISGAISCALKVHGPNLGLGDGPSEVLPTALAMLDRHNVAGVWVVLTCFDPALAPDASGLPPAPAVGVGLALALVPSRLGWQGLRLRVGLEPAFGPAAARRAPIDVCQLMALLDAPIDGPRSVPLHDLGANGRLELWVEGHVQAARRHPTHVPTVQAPHTADPRFLAPLSTFAAEAQR